jgi:gamma-butyrobetaine dioxygenase
MDVVDEIFRVLETKGEEVRFGEGITAKQHALQTAHLAEKNRAPAHLIVAALLHDIGHFFKGKGERHDTAGANWLERHFGPRVAEPVRLHVAAKRYLCSVYSYYRTRLSHDSKRSFDRQGGLFSPGECDTVRITPFFMDAIRLRWWDDQAHVPSRATPDLDHYRPLVEAALIDEPTPSAA